MADLSNGAMRRLSEQFACPVSEPGDVRYAEATAIWAKPIGPMPRAVVHCRSAQDVQAAVRVARDADLNLAVRGGGHDWAGRALCDGLVIDLGAMHRAEAYLENGTARVAGGARAAHVVRAADPHGLAPVAGSVGVVGMAGLTLGGGYGPLIGRFGLALDNLLAAEVVLPDGRIVIAMHDREPELFWALRGGGGNFGVVTELHVKLHHLPTVHSGMLVYPFSEAQAVLQGCAEIMASSPDELTVQVVLVIGPDAHPVVLIVPTWSGPPEQGEARLAPLSKLGTLLTGATTAMSYGTSLELFAPHVVDGRRTIMETCWLPELDAAAIGLLIDAMRSAISPGCAIVTHEFRGAASRVPQEATAFGLRRDHTLIEILAAWDDRGDERDEARHLLWAHGTRSTLEPMALPGGYPSLLPPGVSNRVAASYGSNWHRLVAAKRKYDPDNVFRSSIPLSASRPPHPHQMQAASR
jgi:FAD/FMN-containing dehydrogenase